MTPAEDLSELDDPRTVREREIAAKNIMWMYGPQAYAPKGSPLDCIAQFYRPDGDMILLEAIGLLTNNTGESDD